MRKIRTPLQVADDRRFERAVLDGLRRLPDSRKEGVPPELVGVRMVLEFRLLVMETAAQLKPGQVLAAYYKVDVFNPDGTLARVPGGARHSPEAMDWRKAVYARDGFMCTDCGATHKLHAHHVKSWAKHPGLRFDLDNGITLCSDCHAKRHPDNAGLVRHAHYRKAGEAKHGR